ncbi:MAG: CDP-alcohol phosphatidyltransferase family protein [Candidatus Melainabacteria bacterium]|nr:CDP-alcohol phosphatidyltransferase family protein [Candidatus Melainabacteria bacterium]
MCSSLQRYCPWGVANTVSVLRVLLTFLVAALLWHKTTSVYWGCFTLTVAIIWMDGLDGYLARKLGEASAFGAVFDILCDRVVEQVYWIVFLALGWIPLWVPLSIVTRGVLVDGIRSVALAQGYTAFGSSSMMRSRLGILLVSSRFSRWSYAALKAVAFSLLIGVHTPELDISAPTLSLLNNLVSGCVYGAVFFCLVRGLPVLAEARTLLKQQASQ